MKTKKPKPPIEITYGSKIEHNLPWLSDGHILGIIVGRSGCGKTTILCKIIPNISNLKYIVMCSVLPGLQVHKAIEEWSEKHKINYSFHSDPDEAKARIEEITAEKEEAMEKKKQERKEKAKKEKAQKKPFDIKEKMFAKKDDEDNLAQNNTNIEDEEWGLIVFDDFNSGRKTYTDKYTQLQVMSYQMLRNMKFHMLTITQSYLNSDTCVRNNANLRIRFNLNDKYAVQSFRNDIINNANIPIEGYHEAEELIRSDKHGFIIATDDRLFMANKQTNYEPIEYETFRYSLDADFYRKDYQQNETNCDYLSKYKHLLNK